MEPERSGREVEVKVEEMVEPSPNAIEGSPATGIPYGLTFG